MFTLEQVVPWGRSFDEYRRMFALEDADLSRRILGCGDGPASFNAEATRRGTTAVSFDPIYRCDVAQLRQRIDATCDTVLDQTRRNLDDFVWNEIGSVEELGQVLRGLDRRGSLRVPEGRQPDDESAPDSMIGGDSSMNGR